VQRRERYQLNDDELEWIEVWNDFLRRTREIALPGFPMWSRYWADDQQVNPQAPAWKQVLERKNIEFYRENRVVIRQWLAANPRLRSFPASRQKLEWQAQNTPRDLRLCLLHFRPSGIRAKKPSYTPALVAMAQTPVMGPRMRRLTPLEAARLQGFPDWFDFGSQRDALTYKQLGNAVNVGTVYHVFVEHVRRDRDEIARHEFGAALVNAVDRAPMLPLVPERGSAPSESIKFDLDAVGR
jgi:DNA (cytosine-5)-methyltransferase 1